MTTALDANAIRSRGYEVLRTVPPQTRVTLSAEVRRNRPTSMSGPDAWTTWVPVVVKPGEVCTVVSLTNAGFRGIEASLCLPDGSMLYGVPAGLLIRR